MVRAGFGAARSAGAILSLQWPIADRARVKPAHDDLILMEMLYDPRTRGSSAPSVVAASSIRDCW